jgi:subtilisin-like proprotein convertase family protein
MKQLQLPFALLLLSLPAMAQNVGIGTISPTDQLHTTGTVRFEGYKGPGNRLMQIDSAGRMIVTGAGPVSGAAPYAAIPDNGCSTGNGLTSTINVTGMGTAVPASRIAVRVNITHPLATHLRVVLVAPNGTSLILMVGTASGGANLTGTIFTDAAQETLSSLAAQPSFTGKYKPVGTTVSLCLLNNTISSFGAFGGGNIVPNGAWTLKVYDAVAGTTGTLNNWDISFSGPESFLTAEQDNYVPVFNKGNLNASTIYQNSGNIGIRTNTPLTTLHVSDQSDDVVTVENSSPLSNTTNTFLNFKAGSNYTGRIGTTGTNTNAASLSFYTNANPSAGGLQKRMSITDVGNVGIGIADGSVSERLHIDGGNIKLGLTAWSAVANDRFLKFGDGDYVTIGEAGTDDRMQLTATNFIFKRLSGNTSVGINTTTVPAYTLDVTGDLRTTSGATIQGAAQVGGVLSAISNLQVGGTVKIAGGNPAAGKVLTATDATGNAMWANSPAYNTSFRRDGTGGTTNIPAGSTTLIPWSSFQGFDDGGNFSTASNSYIAPATGTYHFDVMLNFLYISATSNGEVDIFLRVNGISVGATYLHVKTGDIPPCGVIALDIKLTAGDAVSVSAYNTTTGGFQTYQSSAFSGHRLY